MLPGLISGVGSNSALYFLIADATEEGSSSGTLTWPSGTQEGDFAIIMYRSNFSPPTFTWSGSTAHFTWEGQDAAGSALGLYSKLLTSTDISSPPSFSSGNNFAEYVVIFRGGLSASYRQGLFIDAGTTAAITGFTKTVGAKLILSFLSDRDTGGGATQPTSWTQLHSEVTTFTTWSIASISPENYTDGSTITWTGLSSSFQQGAAVLEIF